MEKLKFRYRGKLDEVVLIEIIGFINSSTNIKFDETLSKMFQREKARIVLDFYNVDYINSTGISSIFNLNEEIKNKNGRLVLSRVNKNVGMTMKLLGLTTLVPLFKTRKEAIEHIQSEDYASRERLPKEKKDKKIYFYKTEDAKPIPPNSSVLMVTPKQNIFSDIVKMRIKTPRFSIFPTCEEALKKFDEVEPDIIFLEDKVNGSENFLAKIKIDLKRSLTSVVKIYPTGTDIKKRLNFKIWENEYLIEPFEMMELFALAEAELRRVPKDKKFLLHQTHYQFKTSEKNIKKGIELGKAIIQKANFDEDGATAINAAFREAIDNATKHAHKGNPNLWIEIVFLLDNEKLLITIKDQGKGFDYKTHLKRIEEKSPQSHAKERRKNEKKGGLGIMLMKQCTDRLSYSGKGNVIQLEKMLIKK